MPVIANEARFEVRPVGATVKIVPGNPKAARASNRTDELWIVFDDGLEVCIDRSPGFPEGLVVSGWANEEHVSTMRFSGTEGD